MVSVFEIIESLQATSSRNEKEAILQRHSDNEDFKKVMKFVYDPYVTTGIGRKKLGKFLDSCTAAPIPYTWDELIRSFTNTTGCDNDCIKAVAYIDATPVKYQHILEDIICKALKIGVTAKTLNKVYGDDFIPVIGCMLGTDIKKVNDKHKKGTFVVTEKFDGQRKYIIKEMDGTTTIYSGRNGMLDNDYPEIHEEAKQLPAGFVYDGEMLAEGEYHDSIALRQATNSICAKNGPKVGVSLHVFDMIPLDDYKRGFSDNICVNRKNTITALLNKLQLEHIVNVPILGIIKDCNKEDMDAAAQKIWDKHGEGIMLNRADAPFEMKRVNHLLKVKYAESYDLRVIGFKEGTEGTKNEGILGALVVSYKGFEVGVGSGLDQPDREHIWNNKELYLGRICEVRTFGESINNATGNLSLNSPIFMGWRDDKEEPDFE